VVSTFLPSGESYPDLEATITLITNDIEKAIDEERKLDKDEGSYYGIIDIVQPEKVSITL
jgi:hypothetical protein